MNGLLPSLCADIRQRSGGRFTGFSAIPPRTKMRFRRCFLRAFTALHKFDLKYPFGPWILRIATNYCIDQLRRRKSRKVQLWSELDGVRPGTLATGFFPGRGLGIPAVWKAREGYARVAQALLDGLNPKYRAAFVLREVEERAYDEVAKIWELRKWLHEFGFREPGSELQKKFRAYLSGLKRKERK